MSGNDAQTRVAIMAASEKDHSHLSTLLVEAGLDVVLQEVPGDNFIRQLEQTTADVLLVDLGDDSDSEVDIIDTLLEYDSLPVIFNDSSKGGSETDALWAKKLARRLEKMVRDVDPESTDVPGIGLESEPEPIVDNDSVLELETVTENHVTKDQASDFKLDYEPVPDLETTALDLDNEADMELIAEFKDLAGSDQESESSLELELELDLDLDLTLESETKSPEETGKEKEQVIVPDLDDQVNHDHSGFSLDPETTNNIQDEVSEGIEPLSQPGDAVLVAVKEESSVTDLPEGAAINVWVLGASLGGPQAVRQFLMAIKEDLPVAFVLAQHIGENHISLLAEQLDRVSKFKVFPGYNGHMIRHHEVILAPAGKNIHITDDGYISLSDQEEDAIYSPCINDVMTAVARRYGDMAGTIIFSGMGDDGAIGCQSVAENGGIVWAQDVDSCVISSMPDQARKTNNVTFSANPRRLADELYKYYIE